MSPAQFSADSFPPRIALRLRFFVPDMKLFAGNATPELAQRIANRLYTYSATPL